MTYRSSAAYHGSELIPLSVYPTPYDVWNREWIVLQRSLESFYGAIQDWSKVLYVGCGRRLPNIDVVAIDLDPYVGEGIPNFHCADAENLPFEDNIFDLVVSSHTIEHLTDQYKGISEQARVCKKDGLVGAVIPDVRYTAGMDSSHTREWAMDDFIEEFKTVSGIMLIDYGIAENRYSFYCVWTKI